MVIWLVIWLDRLIGDMYWEVLWVSLRGCILKGGILGGAVGELERGYIERVCIERGYIERRCIERGCIESLHCIERMCVCVSPTCTDSPHNHHPWSPHYYNPRPPEARGGGAEEGAGVADGGAGGRAVRSRG